MRKKASIYGVDLFFDSAVGGRNRENFNDETDLPALKDSTLLHTCRKLELISDVVYRKLDFILIMRNEVAASHPNVESIGGYELLGWLQTCIKDVLQDQLSESAIRIKSLVDNLKSANEVIDENTFSRIDAELKNLSLTHVNNLLVNIFGMFVASDSEQVLRKNISEIAPLVWVYSSDQVKYKIGTLIDGYRTNLHQTKLERGIEFLKLVDGLMYESLPAKIIALEHLSDQLKETHEGWDNFHYEPAVMREILQYCKSSTDIPKEVLPKLTKIVLRCRIGNGVNYKRGVSPGGVPLYDQFLCLLDDEGAACCINALFQPEINSKIRNKICQVHLRNVLESLKLIVISDRLKDGIDLLLDDLPRAYLAGARRDFQELTSPFIEWPRQQASRSARRGS
ncbi:hypothetical protein PN498_14490 [Oscillatoria sp. CS-180]|uniref:hypothetical protein n=1 Tax=Oscillatoria sp. CS-180 TaxID=3021720 RepID=UPI00232E85B6|nr:hypothetical protein [Oscillatoria sp. CS-180]MDB9527206.1 hypothetical protein [Oscillatoria sp. CS-180]